MEEEPGQPQHSLTPDQPTSQGASQAQVPKNRQRIAGTRRGGRRVSWNSDMSSTSTDNIDLISTRPYLDVLNATKQDAVEVNEINNMLRSEILDELKKQLKVIESDNWMYESVSLW